MGARISDEEFFGWVAELTEEMATLSGPRCAELAFALNVATLLAKGLIPAAATRSDRGCRGETAEASTAPN
jgi:hypothetical protein